MSDEKWLGQDGSSRLAEYGFNREKEDDVDGFIVVCKKIGWLDFMFKTKRYQGFKRLINKIEFENWYIEENDNSRKFPIAAPALDYAQKEESFRDFPRIREHAYVSFYRQDDATHYSARFQPDASNLRKSVWIIYDAGKEIMRGSIEDMWKGEEIKQKHVEHCCSEQYANQIFMKLRVSGVEKMYYILTGKIWNEKPEEEIKIPSTSNRLNDSEHD